MPTTADIRNGICIEYNKELYSIIEFQHVKPGKGPAFVRTKLRNLKTGKVISNTFNAGVKINITRVERRPYQFLYQRENVFHFMHLQTYDQIEIAKELINAPELLKEGQGVEIVFHADTETALECQLPPFVELQVTYTEPGLKGDTATATLKRATMETGAIVQVPLFIDIGELIKVDTRNNTYYERVKG